MSYLVFPNVKKSYCRPLASLMEITAKVNVLNRETNPRLEKA